jgi:hypothetical protein
LDESKIKEVLEAIFDDELLRTVTKLLKDQVALMSADF